MSDNGDDDDFVTDVVVSSADDAEAKGTSVAEVVSEAGGKDGSLTVKGSASVSSVSRPETVAYQNVPFVLESSILLRLKQLYMALEVDVEENVTLEQVLYACQHTELADSDIANICGIVVPGKHNADTISQSEFVALMSMICLAQQRDLECPASLEELRNLDGTVLVDVDLGADDRTFAVEPASHLELGPVQVQNIKSRSSGSGIYRHILYDITFSLGYGWDHVGINRTRVQRRYSDFVWLQERFLSKYAAVILPPLPAKKLVGNLDAQFVETRRQALEFYLNRIGEHSLLRTSLEFCVFISSTPRGMDALHKFCAPLKTTSWSESAVGLVSSVWSTFGSYVPLVGGGAKASPAASPSPRGEDGSSTALVVASEAGADGDEASDAANLALVVAPTTIEQDRGFAKMSEKFTTCSSHLSRILERTEDLLKHRRSMGLRIAYLGHAVSEIGAAEKSMRIRGTEGISLVGELLEKVAKLNQDTNDTFESTHVAQLKFQLGTLEMAQSLLESRKELFQQEREAHRKRLAAKKAYANARSKNSGARASRAARRATDSKQKAEQEIVTSVQLVTEATRGIEKEVARFESSKASNLRKMLGQTATVMQQSNLRQKLLWADLARVLSTLSFQNSSAKAAADPPTVLDFSLDEQRRGGVVGGGRGAPKNSGRGARPVSGGSSSSSSSSNTGSGAASPNTTSSEDYSSLSPNFDD